MKIGIVTHPLIGNYGGLLQNYALQQVLIQLGHEPITLDYVLGAVNYHYFRGTAGRMVKRLMGEKVKIFQSPYKKRKIPIIKDFVKANIVLSKRFHSPFPSNLVKRYGLKAIVVGSDQVWRPPYVGQLLYDMFLRFAVQSDVRRIAYAASFGTAEWEFSPEREQVCSDLLKKFNAVSVREFSGINHVARLGGSAIHVLDPTLLLGREGFDKIVNTNESKSKSDYLGAYILDSSEEVDRGLKMLSSGLGLADVVKFESDKDGMGPSEWIDAIRSSKFFVTDSFHGTAFAIMYHVPFLTIVNGKRGADRFYSLISPLGLEYALVGDISEVTSERANSMRFDWADVERRLSSLRSTSIEFLKSALV